MFRPARLILTALLGAIALHGQSRWIQMQNEDFRIFSQVSEQDTRNTLEYFERVRNFFVKTMGSSPSNPLPLDIVIFGSAAEYAPYKLNEFSTAYHVRLTDRDYIVLSKAGEETAHIATHEYFHLVSSHAGKLYPPWLEEGMAELYSTLHPNGDDIEFGAAVPDRVRALASERWVPLATILTADHQSPYYNETEKAGSLYAEGWALVQFLATSVEYNPAFPRMLQAIEDGVPSIRALESVYGQPLERIEQDLRTSIGKGSYRQLFLNLRLDPAKVNATARAADMFDVRLALANLAAAVSKTGPRQGLEELARQDPQRPEVWTRLAHTALSSGNTNQALEYFAKAYALGDHSPELLWDYGRLAEGDKPLDSVRVLGELLKLEPDNLDARIELASAQTLARQPREALATLSTIKQIDAEHGQPLFWAMARAQLELGQTAEARASALRLQSVAVTKYYQDRAAEVLSYVDQLERQTRAPSGRGATASKPAAAKPSTNAPAKSLAEVQGRIVLMDCDGVPSVVVQTSQGRKTYVLEPSRYAITGTLPPGQGLRCGPQDAPPAVRIRYDVLPADQRGDGVVRELHFQ